ncbi:glycosaminoglycan attachment site [Pseudomonas alliivorans]|uniref:glycosaminoglycan attachment site n=1 Tax=Pseudomonas alliivorans TaxID=2810613 RepID=UPI001AEAC280|nr:glycosaminoglycan attachment site [Pseudomonas alliivorans]MBP0942343.1 glycosaminoglycan attachment site [Pseudomonas alliivorans]MEE4879894.1 glycosaminoglycan attachment site [Pseudomonas alliivorans]MEE4932660.1 glycosaminoglycan attachment site [Pseudomonas alliivorans]MEE4936638.1 glycosaminoglycan attachment site [Pseudomonas alliivorans]MEE4941344.1 glycosaminoglycan attachment site [Pseudomonas alliivorans]
MNLFEPIVSAAQHHPNFKNLLRMGNGFTLDVLNDWAQGFIDRDGKFVTEFQMTFNSSFWELYLHAVLKKFDMPVDFTKASPDFCLPSKGFNIEATVASSAQGAAPEHLRLGKAPPADLNAFNFRSIIRLSNSLAAKRRKYLESYAVLDHVQDRPYVVAVTNFDQPFSFMACQRPIEAVLHGYYVDEERYIASGGGEGRLEGETLLKVFKDNGSPIELGLFTTPAYREISAVIFSNCANMGKVRALSSDPSPGIVFTALRLNPASDQPHIIRAPKRHYEENLLDGLRIYHNPYATHPLAPALFRHPSVFQSFWDNDDWVYEQREGQLLFRSVQTAIKSRPS